MIHTVGEVTGGSEDSEMVFDVVCPSIVPSDCEEVSIGLLEGISTEVEVPNESKSAQEASTLVFPADDPKSAHSSFCVVILLHHALSLSF